MLFSTLFASVALPVLAMASPIKPRAGGPAYVPLGPNCTVTDPLPQASAHPGNGTINGWKPSDAAMNQTVYSYYLEQPDFETYNKRFEGCIEQCNGFSGCKSVLFGNNFPTPKGYYGTAGGALDLGCIFFGIYLTPDDFVPAVSGQYVNETAANIYC